jgi:hypothetical protein
MQVKYVLEALSKLEPEDEIIIQWYEKEHIEYGMHGEDTPMSDRLWSRIVSIAEDIEVTLDDFGIRDAYDRAYEEVIEGN